MKKSITLILFITTTLLGWKLYGQGNVVSGKITDSDGAVLPGVSVLVKGTSAGTVTDSEGEFRLTVPFGSATLIFSFIGYTTAEVSINGRSTIDFEMEADVQELEALVVTAFGVSREKKKLGYSVSEVSGEAIASSGQTNIVNALQGKVAGLIIRNGSGAPGSGADILIRGISSLDPTRSNRPLYVIDGIEISDDVDALPVLPSAGSNAATGTNQSSQASISNRAIDINPNDIASMTVLKGAQATALYGIRAANGAIIITTKKGQQGSPQIDLYYSQGWSEVNKTPTVQRDYIDGHFNTSIKRDGFLWDTWGAPVYGDQEDPTSDIYDDFFQNGSEITFGASIGGATDKVNYRFAVDRMYQTGVIPHTNFGKTNFSLVTEIQVTPKLKASASVRYANTGGNKPHVGDKSILSNLSYVTPVADVNSYEEPYVFSENIFAGIIDHPLFLVNTNKYEDDVNRYISGVNLQYDLTDHISLNYKVGSDVYSDQRTRLVHPETDEGSQVNGFVIEQKGNRSAITSNFFAQYEFKLSPDFNLSGMFGQYIYLSQYKYLSTRGEGLALSGFFNLDNAVNSFQNNEETNYRNAAVYGEVTLGYRGYLFLSVTGRNDWSSTLPTANNSYFFPAASLSWVVSDMLPLPDLFSFVKLRGSYAVVGKDASPYNTGTYFQKSSNFPFGNSVGFRQSTLIGDEDLKPEFSNTLELGGELKLLSNRLGADITYYHTDLTDMILSVPISNSTGSARYVTNAGAMTNEGLELSIVGTPVRKGDFSWDVSFNWFKQKGKVDEIADGIESIELNSSFGITNKYVEGGKIGDLYGYNYYKAPDGQLIINESGLPEVNWDTLQLVGNALPDWTSGLTNTFRFKGLDLSVLMEWKKGGDVLDMGRRNSLRNGQLEETSIRYQQVVFKGVNELLDEDNNVIGYQTNTTPVEVRPSFYRSTTNYNYAADVLLEDASWFRVRNISLGYSLPEKLLEKSFLRSVRLSFTAYNVYLSTPFKGYDPEINYFGSGSNIYGYTGLKTPATRSYTFKLNLGL